MDIPVFGNTIQIMYARVTRPLEQVHMIYSKGWHARLLNDVIESIGWYRAFAVLPIRTDIAKNSTYTNTSIGIGASLFANMRSTLYQS